MLVMSASLSRQLGGMRGQETMRVFIFCNDSGTTMLRGAVFHCLRGIYENAL